MLSQVGEMIDAQSWPYGREEELRRWVDGGVRLPLPWPASPSDEEEMSAGFYEELRALRRETGGWVYRDADAHRRVFHAAVIGTPP